MSGWEQFGRITLFSLGILVGAVAVGLGLAWQHYTQLAGNVLAVIGIGSLVVVATVLCVIAREG